MVYIHESFAPPGLCSTQLHTWGVLLAVLLDWLLLLAVLAQGTARAWLAHWLQPNLQPSLQLVSHPRLQARHWLQARAWLAHWLQAVMCQPRLQSALQSFPLECPCWRRRSLQAPG